MTVVPSVAEPTPIVSGRTIVLSVSTFTNGKGETNDTPTISGISEPGATIDISILPDGVNGEVIADSAGKWTWRPTKPLTAGKKDLLVVAKLADGQGQVKQSFTVIASAKGGFGWGWIILIMVLVAVGFGAYVYYKSL